MKPKHKQVIRFTAFFLALFIPLLAFFPQTGYVDLTIIDFEKRTPAPPPSLEDTPLTQFPAELQNYVLDHLPWRHGMIRLNATFNYLVFGTVESTKVMVGKDGWLFSKNVEPENNQFDYQGVQHFTAQELEEIYAKLELLAQKYAEEGREFVFVICPNKERMCAEYMPDSVPIINEMNRADELAAYVSGVPGLSVVYPTAQLLQQGQTQAVYYKYDTHWNELGAYVASAEVFKALGIDASALQELQVTKTSTSAVCDLADVAGIYPFAIGDYVYNINYAPEVQASDVLGNDPFVSNAADARNILVMRDSFASNMMPYIIRTFASGQFADYTTVTGSYVQELNPDIVVLQIVERHLYKLLGVLNALLAQ